jgi:beta-phosphoglucomutase-like phosphatase (HAD superfamily)
MLEGRTDRLPALVIFDCDGVLVDSEIIASRIYDGVMPTVITRSKTS